MKNFVPLLALMAATSLQAAQIDVIKVAEDLRRPEDPALLTAVGSPDAAVRARVAMVWGRIQRPVSINRLFTLLADADAGVRESAAFALGQYGWKPEFSGGREKDILSKLVPLLKDASPSVRLATVEAIGKVGLSGTPDAVKALLNSPSSEERAAALLALYRYRLVYRLREPSTALPDLPKAIVESMLALVADDSALVRRNLVYYFARVKDARGLEAALQLSQDTDLWVRYFAILAIQKTADVRGLDAALRATQESNYILRVAAVNALSAMGRANDIPRALLQDPSFHVRAAIADALGNDSASSLEILTALSDDLSTTVQAQALAATVKRKQGDALVDLKNALNSPAWPVRRAAYDALATLLPDETAAALAVEGAQDADPRSAYAAVAAIGAAPGKPAWEAIQSALDSLQPAIRGAAVEALTQRKESDVAEVAWRTFSRSPDASWIDVRVGLISVLAAIPGSQTTDYLKQALLDPALAVVTASVRALQERGVSVPTPDRLPTISPYRDVTFARNPVVILETTQGTIRIEAYPGAAPIHVAGFVSLAKAGKYNGSAWHRVVSDFVVQGGTFDGSGYDHGEFSVRAEINRVPFDRGAVGMPRADDFDSGSIELFINHVPTPHLDGQYTVFGQVVEGMDVVDRIEVGDVILKTRVIE